jgi:prophage DNA circulation protein
MSKFLLFVFLGFTVHAQTLADKSKTTRVPLANKTGDDASTQIAVLTEKVSNVQDSIHQLQSSVTTLTDKVTGMGNTLSGMQGKEQGRKEVADQAFDWLSRIELPALIFLAGYFIMKKIEQKKPARRT